LETAGGDSKERIVLNQKNRLGRGHTGEEHLKFGHCGGGDLLVREDSIGLGKERRLNILIVNNKKKKKKKVENHFHPGAFYNSLSRRNFKTGKPTLVGKAREEREQGAAKDMDMVLPTAQDGRREREGARGCNGEHILNFRKIQ